MRWPKRANPFYQTKAWKLKRKEALARDNYLCRRCLEKNLLTPADTVHHVQLIEAYPWLALELDNLLSLCAACHNALHGHRGTPQPERRYRARVIKG